MMAKASLTAYLESHTSISTMVDFYNSHKYTRSAPLPADATVADLVSAIKAHAMANFILLPCPNSDEVRGGLRVNLLARVALTHCSFANHTFAVHHLSQFELVMGMVEGSDDSKTIRGIIATMEERKGSKCALVCVDSIAGIYRAGYSDSGRTADSGGGRDNSKIFRVARAMRGMPVGFLVANQATAQFGGGGGLWKACFGISWANCCQTRIQVDRYMDGGKEGAQWKRWMEFKDIRVDFRIVDAGIVQGL
jgi:hypothetical protein